MFKLDYFQIFAIFFKFNPQYIYNNFNFLYTTHRLVPAISTKCTMADKSTKTDDVLLNGDLEAPCPTTTNAATMTTEMASEAPSRPVQVVASSITRNHMSHGQVLHRQESRTDPPKQPPTPPPPVSLIFCFFNFI